MRLLILLILAACSSQSNPTKSEHCPQWNLGCYGKAFKLLEENKKDDAIKVFAIGCRRNHAHSCSQLSYLTDGKELELKKQISLKGCQLGDQLGCYNHACYQCRSNDAKATMKYLNMAKYLGAGHWDKRLSDPDLKCLSKKQLSEIKSWDQDKTERVYAHFVNFPTVNLRSSLFVPKGFSPVSFDPLILKSPYDAIISHSYNLKSKNQKTYIKTFMRPFNKVKVLKRIQYKRNYFPSAYIKFTHVKKKTTYIHHSHMTYTPYGVLHTFANFPQPVENLFEKAAQKTIDSVVYNPYNDEEINNYYNKFAADYMKKHGLHFGTLSNGIAYYFKVKENFHADQFPQMRVVPLKVENPDEFFNTKSIRERSDKMGENLKIKTLIDEPEKKLYKLDIDNKTYKRKFYTYQLVQKLRGNIWGMIYYYSTKKLTKKELNMVKTFPMEKLRARLESERPLGGKKQTVHVDSKYFQVPNAPFPTMVDIHSLDHNN